MALMVWRTFGGQRPRISSRLLANDGAEIAVNTKLWNGKITPFRQSRDVFTTVKPGPINSVFNYRFGMQSAWLHWATDVDVATSPLADDPNFRLYFTGDGRPKITDSSLAANITRSVAANASQSQPTFTIVGPVKGFQAGDTITIDYGSSVTQNATILSVSNGSPNSTITLTTNLSNTLGIGRPVTNTSKRFPLGTYDLGVPAPESALTLQPVTAGTGNITSVADIFLAAIDSGSNYENSVTLAVAVSDGATSVLYDPVAFPSETFTVGDVVQISSGTAPNYTNLQQLQLQTVAPDSGNIRLTFSPGSTIGGGGFPVGARIDNISRGAATLVEMPTNFASLQPALRKSFITGRGVGAESIQIDVDNLFKVTLAAGAANGYQEMLGKGGSGQFRFTHFILRESDGRYLFQEPHVWEIKDGFQVTPSSEGEVFKVTIVDTPPEEGSNYIVGTMIDRAEKIFAGPSTVSISTKIRVRRANRVLVTLEASNHGLQVGDRIQLDVFPINTEFGGTTLDGKSVEITAVSSNFLTCEGQIGAQYGFGGTYKQVFTDDELSPRTYVYTYVATIGGQEMESGPSPPSEIVTVGTNQSVTVTGFINPTSPLLWDTNFSAIRLYRFQEVQTGTGQFLFHSEQPVNVTTVNDTKKAVELLEPLSTIGYLPPPADMKGLIELPNGLVAGFSGKQLLYPVPFQLHAWPVANRRAVHDEIVSLGSVGNSVIVGTKGIPRTFTGDDPASVSGDRIELVEPNLSKRGSVDMGYGYAYPCPRGLVLASLGVAEIVTEDLFTRDEWKQLNPASFVACKFDDRYLCFYDTGGPVPSFTEHSRGGFIIDPKALDGKARLVFLDLWASEAWDDPDTGTAYIVQDGVVREFDAGELGLEYTYRTKLQVLPYAQEMTVMRVEGPRPIRVTVLVEDSPGSSTMRPLYTSVRHDSDDFSLPEGLFQRWQVELRTDILEEVGGVYIADSVRELQRYAAGQ